MGSGSLRRTEISPSSPSISAPWGTPPAGCRVGLRRTPTPGFRPEAEPPEQAPPSSPPPSPGPWAHPSVPQTGPVPCQSSSASGFLAPATRPGENAGTPDYAPPSETHRRTPRTDRGGFSAHTPDSRCANKESGSPCAQLLHVWAAEVAEGKSKSLRVWKPTSQPPTGVGQHAVQQLS